MSKDLDIVVWNMTFAKIDDDGNPELNADGTVKEYYAEDYDCSYLADGLDDDDLTEVQS